MIGTVNGLDQISFRDLSNIDSFTTSNNNPTPIVLNSSGIIRTPRSFNSIKDNITKSLFFHKNKLREMGFICKENSVKWALQKIRAHLFPINKIFLQNVFSYKINLQKSNPRSQEHPFVYVEKKIYNPKSGKIEHFILCTTEFQLKRLLNTSQVFMDGTFKSCPNPFYQLFILHSYDSQTGLKIPCGYILMSTKSEPLYYEVFCSLRILLLKRGFKKDFEQFHSDFETAIMKQ